MQAITVTRREETPAAAAAASERALAADWVTLYTRRPTTNETLFELEAMVAKRMELLAWIDQLYNSPVATSQEAMLDEIGARLPEERRTTQPPAATRARGTTLGGSAADAEGDAASSGRRSGSRGTSQGRPAGAAPVVVFETADEDLVSHLLCRYAFCMSEQWRKWYVDNEERLLRARIRMETHKNPFSFLVSLLKRNHLPCVPVAGSALADDPVFRQYLAYRAHRSGDGHKEAESRAENYYSIPLAMAVRLIRTRSVLCRGGRAILFRDQVQEVFLTVFKARLNKGLHEAFLARTRRQSLDEDETELAVVTRMLDVFLHQFVADPAGALAGGEEGSVGAGDVQGLAQQHFPLCMRQIDRHLRTEGHLKHHGRFMYGLFLRAIGLTLEDSLALFSALMTLKGGGSVAAFSKLSYGYNVRHNYGLEGRKVGYSSESCGTIIALPPTVDRYDCHGCPFRFRDEAALRVLLQREQVNPLGASYPPARLMGSDIEDIVSDCKGSHFTRACYKYYMATHHGAKRDSLFRSPYEYFHASREFERENGGGAGSKGGGGAGGPQTPGAKRSADTQSPNLKEDAVRERKE